MNEFELEILTPEKQFFAGKVEAVICPTLNGDIEILKGHQNLVAALVSDKIEMKIDGVWSSAVVEEGFFEVKPDKVIVFSKYCDSAEDFERERKKREEAVKKAKQQHSESVSNLNLSGISLSRLIVSTHRRNKNINFK